jgi:hypothetical protein
MAGAFGLGLFAASVAAATPAAALPVHYAVGGTLRAVGADTLGLAGARLDIVVDADTSSPPDFTVVFPGVAIADYPVTAVATFTLRSSAPDQTIVYPTHLRTINQLGPGGDPDGFGMVHKADTTFEGTTIRMPDVFWSFLDHTFYTGTGLAPLPEFELEDVASILSTAELRDAARNPLYFLSVPEPGAGLLLLAALAVLLTTLRDRVLTPENVLYVVERATQRVREDLEGKGAAGRESQARLAEVERQIENLAARREAR